jgi:hypothetical protein
MTTHTIGSASYMICDTYSLPRDTSSVLVTVCSDIMAGLCNSAWYIFIAAVPRVC